MVSKKEDKVDFDKLEKELANAVEADQRYWRENDAKLRAVHQKVATYDEFRCDYFEQVLHLQSKLVDDDLLQMQCILQITRSSWLRNVAMKAFAKSNGSV